MDTHDFAKAQGHWILARMGKKVLRPGGKELTQKLIHALDIQSQDNLVEFAPGLGYTASLALARKPYSYIGVDADQDAINLLKQKLHGERIAFTLGNAAHTQIETQSKEKVYGEAMLTMHADHRKSEIIREAHRILKPGGLYAIHELGLYPNELPEDAKAAIQRDLALSIKVNARPLTEAEWTKLLENEGFKVRKVVTNPMHLLEFSRLLDDEGLFGTVKIIFNICRHADARKRILQMRRIFRKNMQHMNAIAIIAEKL